MMAALGPVLEIVVKERPLKRSNFLSDCSGQTSYVFFLLERGARSVFLEFERRVIFRQRGAVLQLFLEPCKVGSLSI